jgi:Ca2+-binding RTX toxin-like protein
VSTDNIVEATSGGIDRIRATAAVDFTGLTVNGLADLEGAGADEGIEEIVLEVGTISTFTGAQLTGNTIAVNESAGTGNTTLAVSVAASLTVTFANLTFAAVAGADAFDDAADVVAINSAVGATAENITGTTIADTINTDGGDDVINGGSGADTITGGAGADSITGGAGIDLYRVAAGSTVLAIGGSGDTGTIAGFDTITDFELGTISVLAESLDMTSVTEAVASNGTVGGTNSMLTIGGQTVKSHSITSGIVTFDDAETFASALSLSSTAHLAAVVQYLQANDLGYAGATVAFVVGGDTYVFMQGDDTGTDSADVLVKLTGVTASSVNATNSTTVGLIDIGG